MSTKASKKLYAYGSNQPLQVAVAFLPQKYLLVKRECVKWGGICCL